MVSYQKLCAAPDLAKFSANKSSIVGEMNSAIHNVSGKSKIHNLALVLLNHCCEKEPAQADISSKARDYIVS